MQLLIVDDEYLVVEELKNAISWKRLGISKVLTSFNIEQAKEVFLKEQVDLMLCDIEMPEGSGLELLSWVRQNYPSTESIFLTCHADFHYAKEAIRLGSLEYILKPVPYKDLEESVAKAIDKIAKDRKLLEDSRFGKYWFKHLPVLIERFWFEIINRMIEPDPKAVKKAAEDRNIPYSEEMRFLPVLLTVRRWNNEMDLRDQKILEFAVSKIATETILKEGSNGQIVEFGANRFFILISLWNYINLDIKTLKRDCETFISFCNQHLGCDTACYIGEEAHAHEIPSVVDKLTELENNNVVHDNKVLLLQAQNETGITEDLPDMNVWSIMLVYSSYNELIFEVTDFLNRVSKKGELDGQFLRQFQNAFMQMYYSVMEQKKIRSHLFLSGDLSVKLQEKAIRSVTDMAAWVTNVIEKTSKYEKRAEDFESIINKAKQYIKDNIFRETSREQVASHLYINPDHLDRIFKKKTGMSVTKYVLQERINTAKELLSDTEIPVGKIAVSMGYKNLSHFSAVFKEQTKINPTDYRKLFFRKQP